jgi:hypothetical protein
VTDTAALANDVEATLENALETIVDPSVAAAVGETLVSAKDATGLVRHALARAAAELRSHAACRETVVAATEGGGEEVSYPSPHAAEVAAQLRALADRLEEHGAWQTVDRLVHELVTDLLVGALASADRGSSPTLAARAVSIGVLAGHDALWSGAGPRLGCAYGYDSLIALVRTTARAA